jgi:hypothetical protein
MMKAEWAIVIGPFHSCEPNVEFLPGSAQRFLTAKLKGGRIAVLTKRKSL